LHNAAAFTAFLKLTRARISLKPKNVYWLEHKRLGCIAAEPARETLALKSAAFAAEK
jgi:hypothetical protein